MGSILNYQSEIYPPLQNSVKSTPPSGTAGTDIEEGHILILGVTGGHIAL
jgi:hypothetical protein